MQPTSPSTRQNSDWGLVSSSIGKLALRCLAYFFLVAGVAFLPTLDLGRPNPLHQDQLFTETSFVELGQLTLLLLSAIVGTSLSLGARGRALGALLAAMLSAALVRELDYFLDKWFFDGAWQVVMSVLLVVSWWVIWPQRRELSRQLQLLSSHLSFGLMFAGASIVIGFSRLFGRGEFWERLMGSDFDRSVKNLAEESIELLGYTLLSIGVVECVLAFRRRIGRSE